MRKPLDNQEILEIIVGFIGCVFTGAMAALLSVVYQSVFGTHAVDVPTTIEFGTGSGFILGLIYLIRHEWKAGGLQSIKRLILVPSGIEQAEHYSNPEPADAHDDFPEPDHASMTADEILAIMGFKIPQQGVFVGPHDKILVTACLRLIGQTMSIDNIPDVDLHNVMKLLEVAQGVAPSTRPWNEEDSRKMRATFHVLMQRRFGIDIDTRDSA